MSIVGFVAGACTGFAAPIAGKGYHFGLCLAIVMKYLLGALKQHGFLNRVNGTIPPMPLFGVLLLLGFRFRLQQYFFWFPDF